MLAVLTLPSIISTLLYSVLAFNRKEKNNMIVFNLVFTIT